MLRVYSNMKGKFKLKSSLRKFYGRHHVLVNRYGIYGMCHK